MTKKPQTLDGTGQAHLQSGTMTVHDMLEELGFGNGPSLIHDFDWAAIKKLFHRSVDHDEGLVD